MRPRLLLLAAAAGGARAQNLTMQRYVKAPNAGANDYFGYALELSGDTLVVGAPREDSCSTSISTTAATDNGCSSAGAVYLYGRTVTTSALSGLYRDCIRHVV